MENTTQKDKVPQTNQKEYGELLSKLGKKRNFNIFKLDFTALNSILLFEKFKLFNKLPIDEKMQLSSKIKIPDEIISDQRDELDNELKCIFKKIESNKELELVEILKLFDNIDVPEKLKLFDKLEVLSKELELPRKYIHKVIGTMCEIQSGAFSDWPYNYEDENFTGLLRDYAQNLIYVSSDDKDSKSIFVGEDKKEILLVAGGVYAEKKLFESLKNPHLKLDNPRFVNISAEHNFLIGSQKALQRLLTQIYCKELNPVFKIYNSLDDNQFEDMLKLFEGKDIAIKLSSGYADNGNLFIKGFNSSSRNAIESFLNKKKRFGSLMVVELMCTTSLSTSLYNTNAELAIVYGKDSDNCKLQGAFASYICSNMSLSTHQNAKDLHKLDDLWFHFPIEKCITDFLIQNIVEPICLTSANSLHDFLNDKQNSEFLLRYCSQSALTQIIKIVGDEKDKYHDLDFADQNYIKTRFKENNYDKLSLDYNHDKFITQNQQYDYQLRQFEKVEERHHNALQILQHVMQQGFEGLTAVGLENIAELVFHIKIKSCSQQLKQNLKKYMIQLREFYLQKGLSNELSANFINLLENFGITCRDACLVSRKSIRELFYDLSHSEGHAFYEDILLCDYILKFVEQRHAKNEYVSYNAICFMDFLKKDQLKANMEIILDLVKTQGNDQIIVDLYNNQPKMKKLYDEGYLVFFMFLILKSKEEYIADLNKFISFSKNQYLDQDSVQSIIRNYILNEYNLDEDLIKHLASDRFNNFDSFDKACSKYGFSFLEVIKDLSTHFFIKNIQAKKEHFITDVLEPLLKQKQQEKIKQDSINNSVNLNNVVYTQAIPKCRIFKD